MEQPETLRLGLDVEYWKKQPLLKIWREIAHLSLYNTYLQLTLIGLRIKYLYLLCRRECLIFHYWILTGELP